MSRVTQKEVLAERQDEKAPFLFDTENLPIREDVLESVKMERYAHKGARLLESDEKAERLVTLLLAGWGLKRIATEMQISKHTARAAREAMVLQGKLAPYKQRIVGKMEDAIETGLDHYLDGIERKLIAPAQIPIGFGILFDKRALALGEPTAISGPAPAPGEKRELSVEALNAYVDGLKTVTS